MSVRFEIDKARQDTFYHYKKYNDDSSVCIKTGWGIWSKQSTQEEKDAWILAVQTYQESHGIKTPGNKIKDLTKEIREKIKLDDTKVEEEKKPLIMPAVTDLIAAIKSAGLGDCTDDYISKVMGLSGAGVPSVKAMFQYTWNATWFNADIDLQELLISYKNLGISGFIYPILDLVDNKSDELFNTAYAVYSEVLRISGTAVDYYYKVTILFGKEDKKEECEKYEKKLEEELDNLAHTYGKEIKDIIYQIFCIQTIIDTVKVVKSGYTSSDNEWKSITNKIRALVKDEYESINKKCFDFLKALLPLLAALAGAFIIFKLMEKKEIEQSLQMSADNLGVRKDEVNTYLNEKVEQAKEEISSIAIVYNDACNNRNKFSLYVNDMNENALYDNTYSESDSSIVCNENDCKCKVSMCDFSTPVDASAILNQGILDYPSGVVIEIQKTLNYSLNVLPGAIIRPGDIIGYINNIPIKSKGEYQILERYDNYIIANENIDQTLQSITSGEDAQLFAQNLIQSEIDAADLTEYNNIISNFTKFSYADRFIRQYMSYYRFPELAQYTREHTSGNITELSTDDFIEEYEKYADDYYDVYSKNVEKIASKKNIKSAAKRGKISEIKKSLDAEKLAFKNNIINLYNNNPGNIKYCSKGRLADYMLYSNYLNYITSDRFEYDEDDPYISQIYNNITDFIGVRSRIELNLDNIKPLYMKFNEYCVKYLNTYWKVTNNDYYEQLCGIFKYDSYLDTSDIIEDASGVGISLYKRVLKYLKVLTKFSEDSQYSIEVTEDVDVNKLLEEQGKKSSEDSYNKDNLEFEKKLKQISFRFAALRRIELSLNDTSITQYVTDKQLQAFNKLKQSVGDEIYEYSESKTYLPIEKLYNKGKIIEPVLKVLKQQTAKEAKILRKITNDCISWYNDNYNTLMNGEIFKSLVEIPWPDPSIIYRNNSKMNYYFFTTLNNDSLIPPTTEKEIEDIENSIGDIPETGEIDVTSPLTAARITDLKYWLKYCAVASAVGAVLPVFWSTGVPLPVMLPTIYMPFVVIPGRVSLIAGLGICGMAVLPMMLFINTSPLNGLILLPINDIIDAVISKLKQFSNMQMITAKAMFTPLIETLNKTIESYEEDLTDVKFQIEEVEKAEIEPSAKETIDIVENVDTTFKATNAINPNTEYTTVNDFAAMNSSQDIDFDALIERIDQLSRYNNNYESLETLSSIYGTSYKSTETGGTNFDAEFTYNKFVEVCNEMKCTPTAEVYNAIVSAFNDSLRSLTINDYDKNADLAAYLANTSVECGFKAVREYSKYSERMIMNTWGGSYFNKDGTPVYKSIDTGSGQISIKTAAQYVNDGEGLFNYVYGTSKGKLGRIGNNTWGDGYKYRGGGFTQLTFKGSYSDYNKFCLSYFNKNFNIVSDPDNINNIEAAVYTSIAYWINRNGSRNLHNVWTKNNDILSDIDSIQLNKSSMPCTSSKYPGVFKEGISETQKKFTACYALVAGAYPTDKSSDTAKSTYIKKLSAFKRIYKILISS